MTLLAHHELLIAVEYSVFAGGGILWAITTWFRRFRDK